MSKNVNGESRDCGDIQAVQSSPPNAGSSGLTGLIRELFDRRTLPQFIRYITTGLISLTTELSLLYIFTDLVKLWYVYSNSIAFIVVYWINFLLNRFWTFKSKSNFSRQMFLTAFLFVFNLFASDVMIYVLTDLYHVYYLISKVFSIGVVVTWNFILYKKVIYT